MCVHEASFEDTGCCLTKTHPLLQTKNIYSYVVVCIFAGLLLNGATFFTRGAEFITINQQQVCQAPGGNTGLFTPEALISASHRKSLHNWCHQRSEWITLGPLSVKRIWGGRGQHHDKLMHTYERKPGIFRASENMCSTSGAKRPDKILRFLHCKVFSAAFLSDCKSLVM